MKHAPLFNSTYLTKKKKVNKGPIITQSSDAAHLCFTDGLKGWIRINASLWFHCNPFRNCKRSGWLMCAKSWSTRTGCEHLLVTESTDDVSQLRIWEERDFFHQVDEFSLIQVCLISFQCHSDTNPNQKEHYSQVIPSDSHTETSAH